MTTFNKLLLPLAPALIIFGPLLIAMGVTGPFHLASILGALATGLGGAILFLKIQFLERKIDQLRIQKNNNPA
jgi:hypothetical protein